MKLTIDTLNAPMVELPSFDEDDAKKFSEYSKGWSLSYVYNFSEIRDVYIALKQSEFNTLNSFTEYCLSISLPYVRTPWNKRRILEHLNALKNFLLIDSDYRIIKDVFINERIGDPISETDLLIFKNIYFNYFRFKEIFSWFIDPVITNRFKFIDNLTESNIVQNSKAVFAFSNKSRFTDSFFYELKETPNIYFINNKTGEDLMRFWDVFIKWGLVLGVLEKFSLRNLDIKTLSNTNIACVYVVKGISRLNLLQYVNDNYSNNYIYLPDLVLDLAITYRSRIEDIHTYIIEQYKINKEYFSFERTSEIFVKVNEIKEGEKIFFPKYNDSYISHLIVRR
ncbi:MAG: hypothetical protein M0D57_04675 [Sphingobacteriales bacterium JAD_PAG50586_3]|nr:MAG: hypothetical protein M0D57_04675 [Sphingobacteriales bacterium JAD_PAG50586_3]